MSNDEALVTTATRGHVGIVTLNRPQQLNALTNDVFRALHGHSPRWPRPAQLQRGGGLN